MRDDIDNVNRFFMPPRLLKKRPSKAKLQRMRRRKRIRRLIALSVIVTAVIVLAVVFTDAGSDMVMTFAKDYVYENMNLNLKAESISGNPLKGYTMKNANVEDENGRKIFTAESLSGYLSLSSLMRGRPLMSALISALDFLRSALISEIFTVMKRELILPSLILSLSR